MGRGGCCSGDLVSILEGFRNAKLGIAISVTTVFIVATSGLEK